MNKRFRIRNSGICSLRALNENDVVWRRADAIHIAHFHPRSSGHHPETEVRMLYNNRGIYLLYRVKDRFVRSVHTEYNAKVHEDSCVECFLQPPDAPGYYNFEVNAGGTLHVNYIIDPHRDENGKRKDMRPVPAELAATLQIRSSLPRVIEPEIREKLNWSLSLYIPLDFFACHSPLPALPGSRWRANFYKCGDKTSHPHWGSWQALDILNFHQPESFGILEFDGQQT
ncbi:MAG: carbohydrate-binding family 9-like protein [Candidatus Neomarinimicrobiota bacterium]|nr:carbohydrate-binding family 9-like protein [Candidatus Neomarinimicrobiota bacterium]MDD3965794.1 carbohydrate-binding family 9-like protein [Candidatus Neomarinimicrobiota bacterium]MDX9779841.1 carbohydrate-binding family 9-like protein [bacterium]